MAKSLNKRLAIFLPSLEGGGAERVIVTLSNALADRGLVVDLVLAKASGPYLSHLNANVNVVDLGASRVLTSMPGLASYLRRERPAALLSVLSHANVIAIAARAMSGVPTRIVASEHNTLSRTVGSQPSLRVRADVGMMKFAYRYADDIVGVSEGVSDDLARVLGFPRERITTVYNPIDAQLIRQKSLQKVEHPWFSPGAPPVLIATGRLTPQKNFPLLIAAFDLLRKSRGDNVRLMILGEGELRQELTKQVDSLGLTEHVALPGFDANPYSYMRSGAGFVLSSEWEGLPTVLIEAMSCGARVVSTDCPSGPAEILENGKWGRLVPMGDAEALAAAMHAALDEVSPPDVFSRAMHFSVDASVDGYLKLLRLEEFSSAPVKKLAVNAR